MSFGKINKRGITLVALVITIIILLILAGISISALTENGLFNKSKISEEKYRIETAREKLELAIYELTMNKQKNIELLELNKINKEGIEIKTKQDKSVEIYTEKNKNYALAKVDGYYFKIYDDMTIEIFSEEIPEQKEAEYIKEGLVVWYDGINNTRTGHSDTTNIWENLVEDANNGTLKNIDFNEESGWTNNSLILDGANDWVQMSYLEYENITVEIVTKCLDISITDREYYITNMQNGGIGIRKKSNNIIETGVYSLDTSSYDLLNSEKTVKIGQIYSISASYDGNKIAFKENDDFYVKVSDGLTTKPQNSTIFAIGTNPDTNSEKLLSGESRSNIEVYSVRIYDRALTEEEMKHNYEIDKERFNIEKLPEEELGYIKDGLVCLYDGKQNTKYGHSNKTGIWQNLLGEDNNGILQNIDFNNISGWTDNSLILDGVNDWVQMSYLYYENMTIEIVAKPLDIDISKYQYYISNAQVGGMGIWKGSNNCNIGTVYSTSIEGYARATSTEEVKIGQIYSMSTTKNGNTILFNENGVLYQKEGTDLNINPQNSTVYAIGTNPNGNVESLASSNARSNIEVYSVRIYNRALTEEEIKHNYEIDKERFNIEKLPEEELGYVKDGLVCLYDGNQNTKYGHSPKINIWQNLVGTINMDLKNINHNSKSGWTKNSLILDGSNDWAILDTFMHYSNMTIEIVVKPLYIIENESTKYTEYYLTNIEVGGMGIYKSNTNKLGSTAYIGGSYKYIVSNNLANVGTVYSLSTGYNGTNIYFRENEDMYTNQLSGSFTKPEDSTRFAIGTNPEGGGEALTNSADRANIEIYSVRIYNRCLTEEEIQANYLIDKERFDIQ